MEVISKECKTITTKDKNGRPETKTIWVLKCEAIGVIHIIKSEEEPEWNVGDVLSIDVKATQSQL